VAAEWREGAGESVEEVHNRDGGADCVGLRLRSTPFEFMFGFGCIAVSQRSIDVVKSGSE
jgi:hypothetical protein